jgi:hypothetical protein
MIKKRIILGFGLLMVVGVAGMYMQGQRESTDAVVEYPTTPTRENNSEPDPVATVPKDTVTTNSKETFDITSIPLGDGRLSTEPKVGSVFSCQRNFRRAGIVHTGDWIDEDTKTWDATKKIAVLGEVYWKNATFSVDTNNNIRTIVGNGLPVGYPTGNFPIAKNDPAYVLDRNPNPVLEQTISYRIPAMPVIAESPTCVPMGAIGVALNGVAIYNALDAAGADAVAREVQDLCNGHPEKDGEYHYHGPSDCIDGVNKPNALIGYALDGFGIYSKYKEDGTLYTNADLDECHGTTSPIMWDGEMRTMYHYVMTEEYPFTVGCFKGQKAAVR